MTSQVINDPFVGKVYGNILDQYDNPSYNIKLYMIQREIAAKINTDSVYPLAPPNAQVILAQTGVTGVQIDNVNMQTVRNPDGAAPLNIRFTIVEPGSATFLDEIQLAKGYLGYDANDSGASTMFLEIRFQGYKNNPDDEDTGGEPQIIAGPYVYQINLLSFTCELNESGSQYDLEAVVTNTFAYMDSVFRLQQQIVTTGKTITEHVESFKAGINEWHTDATANSVPDEIEFDLSNLIGVGASGTNSLDLITDDSLLTSSDPQAENLNAIMNETFFIRDEVDRQKELSALGSDKGTNPELVFREDRLTIKAGTSIEQFFYTLLGMCPEFYSKVSRLENIADPESKAKTDQGFTSWVKINTQVEQLGFCKTRNVYAKKYIYKPTLYKTAKIKVALKAEEQTLAAQDKKTRLEQYKEAGCLLKSYNYIFTGLNDQIKTLDIKFNTGASVMLPPKFGALGDASIINAKQNNATAPADEDLSLIGQIENIFDKVNTVKEKDLVKGLLDKIGGLADDVRENFISQVSDITSVDQQQLRSIIETKVGLDAFASILTADVRQQLANTPTVADIQLPPTEPPQTGNSDFEYTPELSEFVYSADFLDPEQTALNAEDIQRLGYTTFNRENVPPDIVQRFDTSKDTKSPTDSATFGTSDTKNKLFGFLSQQNTDMAFMQTIQMTLRGDPWYLGKADVGDSDQQRANFNKHHQLFYLRIASPIKYDPDWLDEDSTLNSGYWKYTKSSQTFSGVYNIIEVNNSFSGGEFTTEVKATRLFNLDQIDQSVISSDNITVGEEVSDTAQSYFDQVYDETVGSLITEPPQSQL